VPDPRIEQVIDAALGDSVSLLNVGAGTGSYEPRNRQVVALEPSAVMIAQRPQGSAPVVQGRAERLPFRDKSFDAVLAVLTVHHWKDRRAGFAECARVARNLVLFVSIDIEVLGHFWLFDYFPELREVDRGLFPTLDEFRAAFPSAKVTTLPVPADCRDGFLGAYWRRPEAYLHEAVRAGISSFGRLSVAALEAGLGRLAADIGDGTWQASHADLQASQQFDLGYRLIRCSA
jgi:SAM-dependent methyltransferase